MNKYWANKSQEDRDFFLTVNVNERYRFHIRKWADITLDNVKREVAAKLEKLKQNPEQNQHKIEEYSTRLENLDEAIVFLRSIVLSKFKDYPDTLKLKQLFFSFNAFNGKTTLKKEINCCNKLHTAVSPDEVSDWKSLSCYS